jgi:hypothetical protein
MKTNFRLIGDIHGHHRDYHQLLQKAQSTVQVGDFGFKYATLSTVDARQHRILGGNHDNYDDVGNWPHFLGDYGVHTIKGFGDIFFIRGGLSIDRHLRTEGISWWANEELGMAECYAAMAEYEKTKPIFVVSHECPQSIVPYVTESSRIIPSRTNQLLEQMLSTHKPERWVFGHFHKSWDKIVEGTQFTCLNKLECLDL